MQGIEITPADKISRCVKIVILLLAQAHIQHQVQDHILLQAILLEEVVEVLVEVVAEEAVEEVVEAVATPEVAVEGEEAKNENKEKEPETK